MTDRSRDREGHAPPPAATSSCLPDAVCPRCGSEQLASVKCKLLCQDCRAIVMTCCEF